jgi:hypothetical protein
VGPDPSPLEKLLAERVVMTTLGIWWEDYRIGRFGQAVQPGLLLAYETLRTAHNRQLGAIKAQATVR